jgi:hypothetical protein
VLLTAPDPGTERAYHFLRGSTVARDKAIKAAINKLRAGQEKSTPDIP